MKWDEIRKTKHEMTPDEYEYLYEIEVIYIVPKEVERN